MPIRSILSRTRSLPGAAVAAAIAFGPLATLLQLDLLVGPISVAILLGGFTAVGAVAAAAVLLVATGIARARRHTPAIVGHARAVRVLMVVAAIALLLLTLAIATIDVATSLELGVPAAVLLVAARWIPARAGVLVIALLAVILCVEIPRETGIFNITWQHARTTTSHRLNASSSCNAIDAPLPSIPALTKRWRVQAHLQGNVGELVAAPFDPKVLPGELAMTFSGQVETGWASCLFPLHKSIEIDATLTVNYSVHDGNMSCSGGGTLSLAIMRTINGITSCLSAREAAAQEVLDRLAVVARDVAAGR